jgi:hypothetical protein
MRLYHAATGMLFGLLASGTASTAAEIIAPAAEIRANIPPLDSLLIHSNHSPQNPSQHWMLVQASRCSRHHALQTTSTCVGVLVSQHAGLN